MPITAEFPTPRWTWPTWLVVSAVLAWVPYALGFEFKDGDSDLYAELSRQLSLVPFSQWLSPQWPVPAWPAYLHKHGIFEEHMAFFFWPAALLGLMVVTPWVVSAPDPVKLLLPAPTTSSAPPTTTGEVPVSVAAATARLPKVAVAPDRLSVLLNSVEVAGRE